VDLVDDVDEGGNEDEARRFFLVIPHL
jgi:hypothetical protein